MKTTPEPLGYPVRQGLRFLLAWDPDVECEVTSVADGVVTYATADGERADEEAFFADVVGLVLEDAPDLDDVEAVPAPGEGLATTPHGAVLDGLDAAFLNSVEDTTGFYGGQPLPSVSGYTVAPTDEFLRQQIGEFLDQGLIDGMEARRLRELLGDELPPVVTASDFA